MHFLQANLYQLKIRGEKTLIERKYYAWFCRDIVARTFTVASTNGTQVPTLCNHVTMVNINILNKEANEPDS